MKSRALRSDEAVFRDNWSRSRPYGPVARWCAFIYIIMEQETLEMRD